MKRIFITESQFNQLFEGGEFGRNKQGNLFLSMNSKTDDLSNQHFDSRVFGTKNNILYGDETIKRKRPYSFADSYMTGNSLLNNFKDALMYLENEYNGGPFDFNKIRNCNEQFRKSIENIILKIKEDFQEEGIEDNVKNFKNALIVYISKEIERRGIDVEMKGDLYDRANSSSEGAPIFRYRLATVPQTNVEVISLFVMNDFNFSDAMKNGKIRQNRKTDELLGINPNEREKTLRIQGKGVLKNKKIPIKYDRMIEPSIENNFSLNKSLVSPNNNNDHFKKQYGYEGKNGYTSITQFMDKSIIYASNVLKKLNFIPDYIVSVPSSSKYNIYYSTNLSRKLGIPFIPDFFKRNVINIQFTPETEKKLTSLGGQ